MLIVSLALCSVEDKDLYSRFLPPMIGISRSKFIWRFESIKSGARHLKTMNNRSIVQVTLMSAFGLLLVALVPSSVAFAQDTMSNMSGMANETTGNVTGGGNQSEGGSPLSKIPIIGDLLTGGK